MIELTDIDAIKSWVASLEGQERVSSALVEALRMAALFSEANDFNKQKFRDMEPSPLYQPETNRSEETLPRP